MRSSLSRRNFVSALALPPAARALFARQRPEILTPPPAIQDPQPTFSTSVSVVNLFATVRTSQNRIVKGLKKEDFILEEDGRPQTIKYFSQESDLPLTLGLLVDTSASQRNLLSTERKASFKFFDQVLREDRDQAFVIHFDFEVELLQDFTASRPKLDKALELLEVGVMPPRQGQGQRQGQGGQGSGYPGGQPGSSPGGRGPGGRGPGGRGMGGRGRGGGTNLYDAVLLAGDELMSKQKGRKAIILLTDGVDTGSKTTLEQAVVSAQKSDTLVYSVMYSDPSAYGYTAVPMGRGGMGRRGGPMPMPVPAGGDELDEGKKALKRISSETGGRFFEVSFLRPIDWIYRTIEEDLRNLYSIGYVPDRPADPGAYHRIHLATRKKQVVQTREGYYGAAK